MSDTLFYLAVPYTGTPEERDYRYEHVSKLCALLMLMGHNVFSPITHSHPLEKHFGCILPQKEWMERDLKILSHCDHLLVYKMPGWKESKGVTQEIEFAEDCGMPITYFEFNHGMVDPGQSLKLVEG